MLNRIAKGILVASLLTFPQTNTVEGFAIGYDKDLKEKDIKAISDLQIHEDEPFGLHKGYNNLQAKIEEYKKIQEAVQIRLEKIKIREEEQKRLEEERNSYDKTYLITYYSRHPSENGGYNCTAYSTPLREGICANNIIKRGTRIKLIDGRELIVEDKGGTEFFNNDYHLDVFVDTYDVDYVNKLGSHYVKGKIIKE